MRSGEQIQKFGASVDQKLAQVRAALPPDLIIARTSDQPLQVRENIDLFMEALYEAILLVVLIALIGFWEWRSALLMAISMPITLAMTFGMAHMVDIDLQQVSIATLIIALGLLVDDPVVANDAIKRELAAGISPLNAAWLGPTKLARAILYATATNIIAYLPFLMLTGSTGDFLYSLPDRHDLRAGLLAARVDDLYPSARLLSAARAEESRADHRTSAGRRDFTGSTTSSRRAPSVSAGRCSRLSLCFLVGGGLVATQLKSQFFPEDVQYWSYVDVWLPNDAPLSLTNQTAQQAEQIIRRVVAEFEHSASRRSTTC